MHTGICEHTHTHKQAHAHTHTVHILCLCVYVRGIFWELLVVRLETQSQKMKAYLPSVGQMALKTV